MPSINLLPEKFRLKENEERQKRLIFMFSVLLLVISLVSCLVIYISKTTASNESKALDSEIGKVSAEIEKKISENELFLMKNEIKSITELLDGHSYFSKALNIVQDMVTDDIYLKDSKLSFDEEGNLIMEISGIANSYLAAVNQIAIFKNSYWVDKTEISDISTEEENSVNFSGSLKLKKEAISFHKYYWDFGLALLSSKIDRYLKIDEYSAVLKKREDGKDYIEIKFSGVAYDEKKLNLFESNLRQMKVFVKDVSVRYDLKKKNDNDTIDFSGKMKLNMF